MTTPINPQHSPDPQYPAQPYAPQAAEETRIGPGVPPVASAITPPAKRSKMPWIVAGAVALVLFGTAGIILALQLQDTPSNAAARPNRLEGAKNSCAKDLTAVELADNGATLIIDGAGEEDDGVRTQTIACLLRELQTPAAVIAKMDGTNALQGRQEASWEGFTASWTYHPDRGLDLIVQAKG